MKMFKKVLALVLTLVTVLSCLGGTFAADRESISPADGEKAEVKASANAFEIVGEWVWGSTVAETGARTIVENCARHGVTDIYMLTKGTGGTLSYSKTQYIDNLAYPGRDVLRELIDAGHAAGIRIHAWLACLEDATYKANYPEAGMYHYVNGRNKNFINPYDKDYGTYMSNVITEIVSQYDVDGIHLDYIRYNHALYGWSSEDFNNVKAMGANLTNVKYLLNKSFCADKLPAGETADDQYMFKQYRKGNKDALLMGQYRRNNIVALATTLRNAAKAADSDIIFSAAIMPEGLHDEASPDLHYGQNYRDTPKLYDYVVPMAYSADFGYTSAKLAELAKQGITLGNKIVMGIQAFDNTTSDRMTSDVKAIEDLVPLKGLLGIAYFRHASFGYAKVSYSTTHNSMKIEVTNPSATGGYSWIQMDAPNGVKISGIGMGEGFGTDVLVEMSKSNDRYKLILGPGQTGFVLPPLGVGTVTLNFSGTPTDPEAPLVTLRVCTGVDKDGNPIEGILLHMYEDVSQSCGWDEGVITTEPTCAAEGVKTYTCQACGKTQTQTIAQKAEHSYDDGVVTTEPTCTAEGVKTFTCTVCSETKTGVIPPMGHRLSYTDKGPNHTVECYNCDLTYSEAHSFAQGDCVCLAKAVVTDETIKIGHNLNLTSDIAINYAVAKAQLEDYDSYYMECLVPVYEGNTFMGAKTVTLEPELRNGYYYFVLNGLISLEMNNMVEAQLHMTKGERDYVSPVDRYSIATYAYSQMNDPQKPDSLKKVCANLLQYGTKAQLWKGYRTDALADSAMTQEHRVYLTDLDTVTFEDNKKFLGDLSDPRVYFVGIPLSLDSRIVVRYVINTTRYSGKPEDLNLRITYTGVDGEEKTLVLTEPEVYYAPYDYYVFDYDGLLASELRAVMTVRVYEGATPVSETIEYSVDTYGKGKEGDVLTLLQAMMAYSDSAKDFFA